LAAAEKANFDSKQREYDRRLDALRRLHAVLAKANSLAVETLALRQECERFDRQSSIGDPTFELLLGRHDKLSLDVANWTAEYAIEATHARVAFRKQPPRFGELVVLMLDRGNTKATVEHRNSYLSNMVEELRTLLGRLGAHNRKSLAYIKSVENFLTTPPPAN